LCVVAATTRIGVRELRQNLSVYLRRIAAGERFEVTDRGRRVALLVPIAEDSTPLQRLIAAGFASAPEGDLLELGPPPGKISRTLSEALLEEREERLP
jgi:prevent-host-death family protein